MTKLDADPRWRKLTGAGFVCACCGERHAGVFDLAHAKPDFWPGKEEPRPNCNVVDATDVLTEDFCVIEGRYFFVRAVIELPIAGAEERFGYGVWTSLSEKNFNAYLDAFDSGDHEGLGPWNGFLCNRIKGYPDTLKLVLSVHPRSGRERPFLQVEDGGHPLAVEQREGIGVDRLLELYALNGHDIRPSLADG